MKRSRIGAIGSSGLIQVLQEQNAILGWEVQAVDDDLWVLDTILDLAVIFIPPAA